MNMKSLPRKLKKVLKNEKGSVIVLFVTAFTVLLGFTALVFDVGLVYLQDARISNAIDAAALAGSQALPDSPAQAYQLALDYAAKNGVAPDDLQVEITDDGHGINVQAKRYVEYSFAPVLGISSVDLQRAAGAELGIVSSVWGAAPFCIQEQELVYNEEYLLKAGAGNGAPGGAQHSGWFGAVRLSGNGASDYEHDIKYGYQGWLSIGDELQTKNGNMSGPTTRGVNYCISQCKHTPACTSEHFTPDCSRLIKVPVAATSSDGKLIIKGFAMFFLEGVDGQGNQNNVWGKFVRTCLPGELTNDADADYGIYSTHLSY